RAAELASASRSAFVTNVTHELRTPVNAIQGMTSLLRETALDPRQTRCVEAMDAACAQLLTLVGDVIDFARIEDGKIEVASAPFDTASVASQAVEVVRGAAERKGLTVALSLAPEAMGPRLGDAELTRQVLVNLLGNAVKYTEEGRVGLSVSPAPGGALRFEISDTGPGLTDAEIARIFTRFSQGDAGRVAGGSGLGLEIAKSLVERMGGRIGARALPKVGSMFWVELPAPRAAAAADSDSDSDSDAAAPPAPAPREAMRCAARSDEVFTLSESLMLTPPKPAAAEPPAPAGAEPAAPDAAENLPAEDSPAADSPAPDSPAAANADAVNAARAKTADAGDGDHDAGGRPRALLAEDNALNRMLVVQALEALDLEIVEVGNGRDAVDAAASRRFDLILMDIEMPVLSGVEAIKVIRALPPGHGDAPILALTAHASGRDGNFYGAIGATATLPKPLDLGALRETVRGLARL
ncbi:MAG: hybrid sensor histidine kinase/response regulator, partial [Pseudomonadota bacterium]